MAKYLITWSNGDTSTIIFEDEWLKKVKSECFDVTISHLNNSDEIFSIFNLNHARHIEKID